ncbi:dephospho-CoA kinase [Methylophilaceae bacterium]|nr:dephospho-CoA kinase [Methylophilaceae bacterium]
MHIIGLTGGIGSGKSEAAKQFASFGVPIIDLDTIARELLKKDRPGYHLLVENYNDEFIKNNNEIDRKKLQSMMFNSVNIKNNVESILHPMIFKECLSQIKEYTSSLYIVIVIPLLFESDKYLRVINESLLIDCNINNQKIRTKKRDQISSDIIKKIMASQSSRKEKLNKADTIISNDGSLDELQKNIGNFHKLLLQKLGK